MSRSFDMCLAHLTKDDMPRVWSLIVTIFGDLAQGADDTLSGQQITAITGVIGIKPEATRVALHRLKGDGWLWSRRAGRGSDYGLTDRGRDESARVTPRIYGAPDGPEDWHLLVAHPEGRGALDPLVAERSHAMVAPGVVLGSGPCPGDSKGLLCVPGGAPVPDWVRDAVCPADLCTASQTFLARLQALNETLCAATAPLRADEATALRVLAIHAWRRLILRSPALPQALFPQGWAGPACHTELDQLMTRLSQADQAATLGARS